MEKPRDALTGMDEARKFATWLTRELNSKDLLHSYEGAAVAIQISAAYAQADEDSLIKEVLNRAGIEKQPLCRI